MPKRCQKTSKVLKDHCNYDPKPPSPYICIYIYIICRIFIQKYSKHMYSWLLAFLIPHPLFQPLDIHSNLWQYINKLTELKLVMMIKTMIDASLLTRISDSPCNDWISDQVEHASSGKWLKHPTSNCLEMLRTKERICMAYITMRLSGPGYAWLSVTVTSERRF